MDNNNRREKFWIKMEEGNRARKSQKTSLCIFKHYTKTTEEGVL